MNRLSNIILAAAMLLAITAIAGAEPAPHDTVVRHDLKIRLYPDERRFTAEDSITLSGPAHREIQLLMHRGLNPSTSTRGVRLTRRNTREGNVALEAVNIKLPAGATTFSLKYGGSIYHPIEPYGKEQARGFRDTPGIISREGVFLSGNSFWYPRFRSGFVTFTLDVELPAGWNAVSQGERTRHDTSPGAVRMRWESPEPQDEIYLIAARFTEYEKPVRSDTPDRTIKAMVFLRTPDKELAAKYLDATGRYISMYEQLIGPYPYKKFALVENFWETGFGMPSFTLLGPTVIRLPFIINSSYPHEILHNWWGNSVYPDYMKGNWAEGLTAYLSDHLIREQQGGGPEYRQTALQKYADYVSNERDFPLAEFRSRHSSSTEAVGYGKALMFFHMLRLELGDKTFTDGLQDFYSMNKFKIASFDDLRKNFSMASGIDLRPEFEQWIQRPGAPVLKLLGAGIKEDEDGYVLTAAIGQIQPGEAYRLHVPVAVTMEGRDQAYQTVAFMDRKHLELSLRFPSRPLRIDIDPEFDLFRRLDLDEIPPALSQALGAKRMLIVLPSAAGKSLLAAYRELAKALGNSGPDTVEVKSDRDVAKLPADRAVTVLGWENRFLGDALAAMSEYGVSADLKETRIGGNAIPRTNHSIMLTGRNLASRDHAVTLIASDRADALPGLARKLPHYHKYSYLAFEGAEPVNTAKGRWQVLDSPMTAFLSSKDGGPEMSKTFGGVNDGTPVKTGMGKLAPREPLVKPRQLFSSERMMESVRFLAADDLKGRGFGTGELDLSADFIARKFREAGLRPAGDGEAGYFQEWEDSGGDPGRTAKVKNVVGVIPGTKAELAGQSVIIGAHYDHLGLGWPDARKESLGKIHPGADDNASGVAVLVELAGVLAGNLAPDRSIVFVAFAGEEAGKRGSKHYIAHQKRYPADKGIAMLNLDTVGRLDRKKLLLVLGAGSAKEWAHIFRGAGFVTGVEIEPVSEELDSSDQKSFQEAGIPAVQLFTGPHPDYHRPTDTADKIDAEGLVKVASVSKEVIEYLAGRPGPMTSTLKPGTDAPSGPKGERKVGIGTIPDFAFIGAGCRLSGVVPGSPAEACGLKEGDTIIRVNATAVKGLKDLSGALKALRPGEKITVIFLRDGKEMTVETEAAER